VRVSVDSLGTQGNAPSSDGVSRPSISGDGGLVAFASDATNLVAGDTNAKIDVFVHDLAAGATWRVSASSLGLQGNGASYNASMSLDGRHVGFTSDATNLVPGDTNTADDAFVHDLMSGATIRASLSAAGAQGNGHSSAIFPPALSADGARIAFESGANNLVPGDVNAQWDVFVRVLPDPAPPVYCTAGTSAGGCAASIGASAEPDLAHASPCSITIQALDGQRTGIVFYGLDAFAQPWCASGGTSFLCVKPPTQRTSAQSSGGSAGSCDGSLSLDWNAFQLASPAALGQPWSAGAKAYVQGWFRDPASCKTTSLSDAVELTYRP
jgi:hypothetical protein